MNHRKVNVTHYLPTSRTYETREYQVPSPPGTTLLDALEYIYNHLDPDITFRYGCRYNRCGLCAVMANGKPRLACKVMLENVEQVAPLESLIPLRGLTVDRSTYMNSLHHLRLFVIGQDTDPLGPIDEDSLHMNLMHCLECLCCNASCHKISPDSAEFAGPYALVKLCQLHLDPRDEMNRTEQAKDIGLQECIDCQKCICPNGIRLQEAIQRLATNAK
ncbi:MAG: hypothetical protein D5S00_01375 [Tindallia sp. MSAO_Bac2]|nr:MAG: hypothetical protein D5S00_01375 [Tindallia sp. MSAO_Bac2]